MFRFKVKDLIFSIFFCHVYRYKFHLINLWWSSFAYFVISIYSLSYFYLDLLSVHIEIFNCNADKDRNGMVKNFKGRNEPLKYSKIYFSVLMFIVKKKIILEIRNWLYDEGSGVAIKRRRMIGGFVMLGCTCHDKWSKWSN